MKYLLLVIGLTLSSLMIYAETNKKSNFTSQELKIYKYRNNAEQNLDKAFKKIRAELAKDKINTKLLHKQVDIYLFSRVAYTENLGDLARFDGHEEVINQALDVLNPNATYEGVDTITRNKAEMRIYIGEVKLIRYQDHHTEPHTSDYYLVKLNSLKGESPTAPYDTRPMSLDLQKGKIYWVGSMGLEKAGPKYRHMQVCNNRSKYLDLDEIGVIKSDSERRRIYETFIKAQADNFEVEIRAYDNGHPLSGKCIQSVKVVGQ